MDSYELRVEEIPVETPAYEAALAWEREHGQDAAPPAEAGKTNAPTYPPGRSVAYWASVWDGLSARVPGPDGQPHDVDLSQWGDRDPSTTFVRISFRYVDPAKVGTYAPRPAG